MVTEGSDGWTFVSGQGSVPSQSQGTKASRQERLFPEARKDPRVSCCELLLNCMTQSVYAVNGSNGSNGAAI